MNILERFFRRRAMVRDVAQTDADLPPALQAVPPGTIVPIFGVNFRVVHRRCEQGGRNPALVLAPIGPTRKRLKARRAQLRSWLARRVG